MTGVFSWAMRTLKGVGNPAPVFDARQLYNKYAEGRGDVSLSPQAEKDFVNDIRRRAAGEPLQYILGEWEFMSLPFKVGPGVLIPRQDTEILCEKAIEMTSGKDAHVLDLCCGTGCIGIALAHFNPSVIVTAADISPVALEFTRENAKLCGVSDRVKTATLNVLTQSIDGRFDIIVSNPPYIKSEDLNSLQREVACYEPRLALDGGPDGLLFYKTIAKRFSANLKAGGAFIFELGIGQEDDVALMFDEKFDVSILKDLSGINRVIMAKLL